MNLENLLFYHTDNPNGWKFRLKKTVDSSANFFFPPKTDLPFPSDNKEFTSRLDAASSEETDQIKDYRA